METCALCTEWDFWRIVVHFWTRPIWGSHTWAWADSYIKLEHKGEATVGDEKCRVIGS